MVKCNEWQKSVLTRDYTEKPFFTTLTFGRIASSVCVYQVDQADPDEIQVIMSRAPTKSTKSSLFDEIFRLQTPAPELDDVDPEDQDEGLQASLVDGSRFDTEALASTSLKKQAAIIDSDPKYQGKSTARKDLYSDEEDASFEGDYEQGFTSFGGSGSEESGGESSGEDSSQDDSVKSDDESEDLEDEEQGSPQGEEEADASVVIPPKSDDREKGRAVLHQLGVWDDLMRCRISLQKVVMACNRLPQADTWSQFTQNEPFAHMARDVHSSVRKLMSLLLELQEVLDPSQLEPNSKEEGSDEEITSESEGEEDEEMTSGPSKTAVGQASEGDEPMEEDIEDSEEKEEEERPDRGQLGHQGQTQRGSRLKRKLDGQDVESTLAKRHQDFQEFRNTTLAKWDEKTRLTLGKVRAKNFAAFEMSVLKQIEQVLVNRDRLTRRIHQVRSGSRVLGRPDTQEETEVREQALEDDEEEIEVQHQGHRSEPSLDPEVIDDSDFYHVCLRDLLETKQSEELDPVTASKQRLEIQRLRNKQKKKVDTKASKGRKIRYHVKEKLKNYMTPFDKSTWSDQQKDDLFKAVFGGGQLRTPSGVEGADKPTINIGL